jgi:hypothetical protein
MTKNSATYQYVILTLFVMALFPGIAVAEVYFNGVWHKSNSDHVAVLDLKRADIDRKQAEMVARGYQLSAINGYAAPDGSRFNAIWVKGDGDKPAVYEWARADFDRKFAQLQAKGYRPVELNAFVTDAGERFNAIWVKSYLDSPAVWGWARADFDKKCADMQAKGYSLIKINAFITRVGERFNAIWCKGCKNTKDSFALWGWNRTDFDRKSSEMQTMGYYFADLNSFGAPVAYNAIWFKGKVDHPTVWALTRADFDAKQAVMRSQGYQPMLINCYTKISRIPIPSVTTQNAGTCSISGRLIGGNAYWNITWVGVRGPYDYSKFPADPVRVNADGTYEFSGIPQGTYKVYTDIHADYGTGFKPPQLVIDCKGQVKDVNFKWPMSD